jgi:hypothetical protein
MTTSPMMVMFPMDGNFMGNIRVRTRFITIVTVRVIINAINGNNGEIIRHY